MPISPGNIYSHYKHPDKKYEIIAVGRNSETLEEMVIYKCLYESEEYGKNQIWIRPKAMFEEELEVEGKNVARFKLEIGV